MNFSTQKIRGAVLIFVCTAGAAACAAGPETPSASDPPANTDRAPVPAVESRSRVFQYDNTDPYDRANLWGFNHGPSVTLLSDGRLLAAWFSGPFEASVHQAILGAYSDDGGETWGEAQVLNDTPRTSDYDPGFINAGDQTHLFYGNGRWSRWPFVGLRDVERQKVGTGSYHVLLQTTRDGGKTWTERRKVSPAEWNCRANGLQLSNGDLVIPVYRVITPFDTALLRSTDGGETWELGDAVKPDTKYGGGEPTVTEIADGELLMAFRHNDGQLWMTRSPDFGQTWEPPAPTDLLAATSSHHLMTTSDGRVLLIHNPTKPPERTVLTLRASDDGGRTWGQPIEIARTTHPTPDEAQWSRQVSYPSAAELPDGSILIVWTHIEMDEFEQFGIIESARVRLP